MLFITLHCDWLLICNNKTPSKSIANFSCFSNLTFKIMTLTMTTNDLEIPWPEQYILCLYAYSFVITRAVTVCFTLKYLCLYQVLIIPFTPIYTLRQMMFHLIFPDLKRWNLGLFWQLLVSMPYPLVWAGCLNALCFSCYRLVSLVKNYQVVICMIASALHLLMLFLMILP